MNRMKAFTIQQIKEECTGSYFSADYHFSKGDKNICLTINWFFSPPTYRNFEIIYCAIGTFPTFWGLAPHPTPRDSNF